jgi:hypothetical protein
MDAHSRTDEDRPAERATRVLSHLDGALDETMLDAMTGTWSMLEHAAANAPAHARAVRARLFWESLRPGGAAAEPSGIVVDLNAAWAQDEDPEAELELEPEAEADAA